MPCFCALCSRDAESAKLRLLLVVVVVVMYGTSVPRLSDV